MLELTTNDLRYVATRLPRDIRDLLTANPRRLYVAGGFIRATIAGETPSDIDIFGDDKAWLDATAERLAATRGNSKLHRTKNAITLLTPDRLPVQFITRWTFGDPRALIKSFDYTVCQAALWRGGNQSKSPWCSRIGEGFYVDLAGRRLVYTHPQHEEEAGGSLLRAIKYIKRGYSIQVSSLGGVVARLAAKVHDSPLAASEEGMTQVITGLLREVDPLLVIDGMEAVDDHEPAEQSNG